MVLLFKTESSALQICRGVVGRPWKSGTMNATSPHSDAQNKSAWKAKTVIARTWLMLERVHIVIITS